MTESTELNDYVPEIVDDSHAKMIVRISKCPTCNKKMIVNPGRWCRTFPRYFDLQFENQLKRAGIQIQSHVEVDDYPICHQCLADGKASFLCALCQSRKTSDKEQFHCGDPPEFLCTDCYETVPAKLWEETVKGIEEDHRYDWE